MNLALENIASLGAPEGLALLSARFPGEVAFSTSLGMEDQVITDMIFRNDLPVRVFTLDTGRLFAETYALFDTTRRHYGKNIEVFVPKRQSLEQYLAENGMNAFYESIEQRKTCCHLRKVEPLRRALAGARVWVTGLRAEQSNARQDLPAWEWDPQLKLNKYHPLLNWTLQEVEDYIGRHQVPVNPLHKQGFISIGCAPCTRAILPGEHPRDGRWWWENSHKECGLHIKSNA